MQPEKTLIPRKSKGYLHPSMQHPLMREWVSVDNFKKADIIFPIFVHEDAENRKQEIELLPDNYRWHFEDAPAMLKPLVEKGLRSVILFGVVSSEEKNERGTKASGNAVTKCIELLKNELPELMIICDLCLCPYTDHGHCGILKEDETIDNDKSLIRLGEIALDYIEAGAHMIAPSDCMDCRIGYLKNLFREKNLQIPVMSYGSKFCSKLYGPFRSACGSAPSKTGRNQY